MGVTARNFFTQEQQEDIRLAIMHAELDTSSEIRVHIEMTCEGDPVERGWKIFQKLDMHKTEQRNGILFYLAVENRKFAVLGDEGIHKKVPDDFWEKLKRSMLIYFSEGQFAEGLIDAITKVGLHLKKYFPQYQGNTNELPDDISFGEEKEIITTNQTWHE